MNDLAAEIVEIIRPAIKIMAKPVVENNCERLGLDPDNLTREDLAKLIPKIQKGVKFFSAKPSEAKEIIYELQKMITS